MSPKNDQQQRIPLENSRFWKFVYWRHITSHVRAMWTQINALKRVMFAAWGLLYWTAMSQGYGPQDYGAGPLRPWAPCRSMGPLTLDPPQFSREISSHGPNPPQASASHGHSRPVKTSRSRYLPRMDASNGPGRPPLHSDAFIFFIHIFHQTGRNFDPACSLNANTFTHDCRLSYTTTKLKSKVKTETFPLIQFGTCSSVWILIYRWPWDELGSGHHTLRMRRCAQIPVRPENRRPQAAAETKRLELQSFLRIWTPDSPHPHTQAQIRPCMTVFNLA